MLNVFGSVTLAYSWAKSSNPKPLYNTVGFVVVQSLSRVRLSNPIDCRTPRSSPRACSNSCPSSRWCHPTISSSVNPFASSLHSFPTSGLFQCLSSSHQVVKYWSFSFSISPSKEYSGLISFRMDWLDLLAVQGTLKSLLQHHSSEVSILPYSAFFVVQLSHPYMTTGKAILWLDGPLLAK